MLAVECDIVYSGVSDSEHLRYPVELFVAGCIVYEFLNYIIVIQLIAKIHLDTEVFVIFRGIQYVQRYLV